MVGRRETSELGEAALRRKEADRMIFARQWNLSMVHGTADHAGYNPALWKPYHVVENRIWTQAVEKIFDAALASKTNLGPGSPDPSPLANLEADDLPAMLIAASYFYPDLTKLYSPSSSLAKQFMTKSGVFRERDFEIVDACINAAVVRKGPNDPIVPQAIDPASDYTAHQKIFVDALWGCNNSLRQTPYLVALLGLERLIENDAIHVVEKDASGASNVRLPRTLEELEGISPTDKSDKLLRSFIKDQDQYIFGVYKPQLATSTDVLTYFDDNQRFFREDILPMRTDPHIHMAEFLRVTREFLLRERLDSSEEDWVASLN